MALRAFWRRGMGDGQSAGDRKPVDTRVRRAAGYAAEGLEARRLLAATAAEIIYNWNHMPAALRHELAVFEYVYPEFQERLNADLAQYGLEPIAPEAGTLAGATGDGRSRVHANHKIHRPHKIHAKPDHRHGRDAGAGPIVTDFQYYYDTLPNTVSFTFDQAIDVTNAPQALTVIDVNSGQHVDNYIGSYSGNGLNVLTYQLNDGLELASGNYAVLLDGSLITSAGNPNLKMLGSDGVAGDPYVHNFVFQVGDTNNDGVVGLLDFNQLQMYFGTTSGANYRMGDFNHDGKVLLSDFNILGSYFGVSVKPLAGPGMVYATAVSDSQIRLDWGASAGQTVTHYDVYRDDVRIGQATGTTFTDTSAGGGTSHSYFVVAKDDDNLASEVGAVVVARTAATVSGTFLYQDSPQQLKFTFNQPMTGAWDSALTLINLKTGAAVAHGGTYSASSPPSATYDLSSVLPDGNYAAVLKGGQVTNADGTPLVGSDGVAGHDYVYSFYFLDGHLTLDEVRAVTTDDVNTVTSHSGSAGNYSYGDVNYSGSVDQADVDFMTAAAGKALPLLGKPGTPAVSSTSITHDSVAQITVAWGASATAGVVYDLYRDYARVVNGISQTSWTDPAVAAGSTHVYFVVARDAATQNTSYVSGELIATAAVVPPLAPTGYIPVEVTANSVLLAWGDDDPAVTGYNVYRSDLQHAEVLVASNVAGTAYYDAGLTESMNYTYRVEAVTAAGASGVSSTYSVSTYANGSLPGGYGVGKPSMPGGVTTTDTSTTGESPKNSIRVSWSPSSGSGPIVYEIDRDGVAVGGTISTSFDDNTVSAGVTYTYKVVAYDAAYNKSDASAPANGQAAGDVETPGAPLDLQVTGVTDTSVSLSWVKPGDDGGVSSYLITRTQSYSQQTISVSGSTTTYTDNGLTPGLSYSYSIIAVDASGKPTFTDAQHQPVQVGATTAGGTRVQSDDSAPNQYVPPEWQSDFYDNLTAVLRQRIAAVGNLRPAVPQAQYWYDAADLRIFGTIPSSQDPTQIHGLQGQYAYEDVNNDGRWGFGEPVWAIVGGSSSIFGNGDAVLTPPNATVPFGTLGRTNIDSAILNDNSTFIWSDTTTFRQDIAAFYQSMDNLLPDYASGHADPFNPASERMSVGAALTSAPVVGFQDDSLNFTRGLDGRYLITDTADALLGELVPGDNVQLDGVWYPASAGTDSILGIGFPFQYVGNSAPKGLQVRNWTLISEGADARTGTHFTYERGIPGYNDLLFPQQASELHFALGSMGSLAPMYGIARFDANSSAHYLRVATKVISAYNSVFVNRPDTWITSYIFRGDADPGRSEEASLMTDLRVLVDDIAAKIYVRGTGPGSKNGWAVDNDGSPITFANTDVRRTLLPLRLNGDDQSIVVRESGKWSNDSYGRGVGDGSAIDPEHLDEIERFVDAMTGQDVGHQPRGATDQRLYVKMPMVDVHSSDNGAEIAKGSEKADIPKTLSPLDWPVDLNKASSLIDAPGTKTTLGHLSFHTRSDASNYDDPTNTYLVAIGDNVMATLSSGVADDGGTAISMLPGPTGYNTSGWGWGTTQTLINVSADAIAHLLVQSIPGTPARPSTDTGSRSSVFPGIDVSWTYTAGQNSDPAYTFDNVTISAYANLDRFVMGELGLNQSFSYTPGSGTSPPYQIVLPGSGDWLPIGTMPDPLSHPIPLTTEMDYRNVQPDVNVDGVLNVPVGLDSFGNDTGVIEFGAERGVGQSYIPVFTTDTMTLPLHAYIQQGAFVDGAGDGKLLATDVEPPGLALLKGSAAVDGLPYFYSLDTYVRRNVLINDSVNHVKRMEVIRPGGNAVVFDFPWDPATNAFKAIGTPTGWNGRDSRRTYVLRDLNPLTPGNMKYALEFADGTVQTFDTTLKSVSDASGLTMAVNSGLQPVTGSENLTDASDSNRYSVTINRSAGRINSVDYATKPAGSLSQTIHTVVAYDDATNPNLITGLTKTGGGVAMPEYSYQLSGNTITSGTLISGAGAGVTVTRSGPTVTNVADTDVTITVTPTGALGVSAGTSVSDVYRFNSDGLLKMDTATLNPGNGQASTTAVKATYTYYAGARASNGSAPWGRVRLVTPGVGPWTGYVYDATTGWVTDVVTPFKNAAFSGSDPKGNVDRHFTYADSVSAGWGQGTDPMSLAERPREEQDYVQEVFVGGALMSYAGTTVVTRKIEGENDGWSAGLFETKSSSDKYTDSTVTGLGVVASTTTSVPGTDGQTTVTTAQSFGGNTVSNNVVKETAWGGVASSDDSGIGSVHVVDTGSPDAYGRSLSDTISGGGHTGAHYDPAVSWFGPDSVTESDGSTTRYTYSPSGRVASKIVYSGTNHAVRYNWEYDGAGNAVTVTTAAVTSTATEPTGGEKPGTPVVKNLYVYDALGRLTREVDDWNGTDVTANRTTGYAYTGTGNANRVTTVTNPDGSVETVTRSLDGALVSDAGTAVTSSYGDEGVIDGSFSGEGGGLFDAYGIEDSKVKPGTWSRITADGSDNTTTTYRDVYGRVYLMQKTQPGSGSFSIPKLAEAMTSFDGNGRVIKYVDFDGTTTYSSYDPRTGQLASQFVDMNGDGVYTPGVDRKSNSKVDSTIPAAGAVATSETQDLANTGVTDEVDSGQLIDSGSNAGSDVNQTVNGLKTRTQTTPGVSGGWTSTTTNPDGTRVVDTYSDGLLVDEKVMPVSGSTAITDTAYAYDGLRRLISKTDFRGVTTYEYFEDGTQRSVQEPGHDAVRVDSVDEKNDAITQSHRADGGQVNTPRNLQGQTSVQTGAGVLPAGFTYDTANTGQLTRLTTYQSASVSGSTISGAGATTQWGYDPASGLLTSKTFADGSKDQYQYNGRFQLANVIEPGLTGSSFAYDNGGQLVSKTLTDAVTGKVSMQVGHLDGSGKWVSGYDEMGRAKAVADTDNGHSYTTLFTVDALQRPVKTVFGSAGNASVNYDYAASSGFGATESAGALRTMTVKAGDQSTVLTSTSYTYDPNTKRLATISVNGVTFTFSYFSGSDQIYTVLTTTPGGAGVTTTYLQDSGDKARIAEVRVQSGNGLVGLALDEQAVSNTAYSANGFNRQDQIVGQTTGWKDVADDGTVSALHVQQLLYSYDSGRGDALVGVTDGFTNTSLYSYSYDQVGNFTGNASLGPASSVNQYSALTYNGRGDVSDDGTYAYGYDANDRLVTVTPHDTTKMQLRYGYDSQGRRLWKTAYTFAGGAWAPSYTRHYLWDGSNLVAELDGNNAILTGYTWGPTGLLAVTDYSGAGPVSYVVGEDLSGNVVALFDAVTGLPVASFKYDPYGNPVAASGPKKNLALFRGKGLLADPETPDIQHALMRDARGSEWLERDPAGEIQGGLNLHQMYGGDPVNKSDPSGLDPTTWDQAKRILQTIQLPAGGKDVGEILDDPKLAPAVIKALRISSDPQTSSAVQRLEAARVTMNPSGPTVRTPAYKLYPEDIPLITSYYESSDVGFRGVINHVFDQPGMSEILLGLTTLGAGVVEPMVPPTRVTTVAPVAADEAAAAGARAAAVASEEKAVESLERATAALREPATAEGFVGPTIGRSGYRTMEEFNAAVAAKYQQLVDQGYSLTMERVAQGLVENEPLAIGTEVDKIARVGLRDWLKNGEGIQEGPGRIIRVNRWLRDPAGSDAYRIPDVYIPGARSVFDATIAEKGVSLPQTIEFRTFSGGGNVTIIRPSTLATPGAQGSYGLYFK